MKLPKISLCLVLLTTDYGLLTPLSGTPKLAGPPPLTAARRPAVTRPATSQTAAAARPPPGQIYEFPLYKQGLQNSVVDPD